MVNKNDDIKEESYPETPWYADLSLEERNTLALEKIANILKGIEEILTRASYNKSW